MAIVRSRSFLFLDEFEENANISVAINSVSTVSGLYVVQLWVTGISQWWVFLSDGYFSVTGISQWRVFLSDGYFSVTGISQWQVFLSDGYFSVTGVSQWQVFLTLHVSLHSDPHSNIRLPQYIWQERRRSGVQALVRRLHRASAADECGDLSQRLSTRQQAIGWPHQQSRYVSPAALSPAQNCKSYINVLGVGVAAHACPVIFSWNKFTDRLYQAGTALGWLLDTSGL